jgi:hypothetical protein
MFIRRVAPLAGVSHKDWVWLFKVVAAIYGFLQEV